PGLRERLGGQVEGRGLGSGLALEPSADPHGVAVVELAERLRVRPGCSEQLGVVLGHEGGLLSRRCAHPMMIPVTKACLRSTNPGAFARSLRVNDRAAA